MTTPIEPPDTRHDDGDVRRMLDERARSVTPQGTFADIEARLGEADAGRRRGRVVLAAAAAVVLVVLAAVLFALGEGDPDETQRIDVADSSTTEIPPTSESPQTTGQVTTTDGTDGSDATVTTSSAVDSSDSVEDPDVDTADEPPPGRAVSELTPVRIDGIGAISVSMTVTEASAATGQDVAIDPNSYLNGTGGCGFAQIDGLPGIWFMVDGDRITRVDITGAGTPNPTDAGVGVGSTPAEVRAAYPGMVTEEPHLYPMDDESRNLVVTDPAHPGHQIIFSVHQGAVVDYRAGLSDWVAMPEGCA